MKNKLKTTLILSLNLLWLTLLPTMCLGQSAGGQIVLVPGTGWTGPTVQPAPIGNPGDLGYDAMSIALWDVVPRQDFSGNFEVGVVAFHMNGIDRVEFAVEGGAWAQVREMTLNPRTNVWEYWVMLDADDFNEGRIEVRAIAYPQTAGEPRLLESLILFVDKGSLSHDNLWVDGSRGNDANPGTSQSPYRTVNGAIQGYLRNHSSLDGLTLYMAAGEYITPNWWIHDHERWMTITAAPGADPAQVKFVTRNGTGRCNIQYLKFHRVTMAPNTDDVLLYASTDNRHVWFDLCTAQGMGRYVSQWSINREAKTYFTRHTVYDFKHGISVWNSVTPVIRDVHLFRIGEDAFRLADGGCLLVNSSVEDQDVGTTDFHPDVVNMYTTGIWENVIVYGLTAIKDINAQGVSPCGIKDMAVVNCLIHRIPEGVMGMNLEAPINHYVISNSTFTTQFLSLRYTQVKNMCLYNSVFGRMGVADGVTHAQFNELVRVNNIHIIDTYSNWVVSDGEGPITFGDAGFTDFDNLDFHPTETSVLSRRLVGPMTPVDVNNELRGNTTAIGALRGQGWDGDPPDGDLSGDVTGNGEISSYDASLAAQYSINLINLSPEAVQRADVTGNNEISSYDASLIAQYAIGLIEGF